MSSPPLVPGLPGTPLGDLLVAIMVLGLIVFVGRVFLNVPWRVVVTGWVLVGLAYVVSLLAR